MSMPAGTAYINGFAVSPDGALYVTLAPAGGTITSMLTVKPAAGTAIQCGLTAQDIGTDFCGVSVHQTQTAATRRSIGVSAVQIYSPIAAVAAGQQYGVAGDFWSWVGLDVAAVQASQAYLECTGVSAQVSAFVRVGKTVTLTNSMGIMVQTPTRDNTGGTLTISNHYGIRIRDQSGHGTNWAALQLANNNPIKARNQADNADLSLAYFDTSNNLQLGDASGLVNLAGYSTTMTGTLIQNRTSITYSASMTPSAIGGNTQVITITNGTAFAINAPTNPVTGMVATYMLRNTSGGAAGVATWNAVFKFAGGAAPANPATANSRSIQFIYDGTNWVETFRAAADVAN